ncbi:Chromatin assembly factor 1 subunit [Blastocladiella emersonii ATCC 22665]|nr:Chromatin assembly factor 1 subunit [Blastocladiella emersonii ATCC 22665]
MKAKTVQIAWHRAQTITSVDFAPTADAKFATAGGDDCVRLWEIVERGDDGKPEVVFLSTLAAHHGGVNIVRWAPQGDRIASADNSGAISIWVQSTGPDGIVRGLGLAADEDVDSYKEVWRVSRLLTGHTDEVSDLAWSPCGRYLASVGTDQKLRIWDTTTGDSIGNAHHHTELVQGVAWDPLGQYVATQGVDRTVNIYSIAFQHVENKRQIALLKHLVQSAKLDVTPPAAPAPPSDPTAAPDAATSSTHHTKRKFFRLFSDPTTSTMSFFRRLAFSPDGSLLVCPAGHAPTPSTAAPAATGADAPVHHAVLVYGRANWAAGLPLVALPGFPSSPWTIRFAPVFIKNKPPSDDNAMDVNGALPNSGIAQLPYRMLMAVGTDETLAVYDTGSRYPRAVLRNLHVYRYQDLAWSRNARYLVGASHDGYCTLAVFDHGELGETAEPPAEVVAARARVLPAVAASSNVMSPGRTATAAAAAAPPPAQQQPQVIHAPPVKKRIQPTLISGPLS